LVQLQTTNLMISRQRLAVERQRLCVERTLGEQIILSLQSIEKMFAPARMADGAMTNGDEPKSKRAKIDDDEDYNEDDSLSNCD
jgi:hypothetical protein